MTSLYTTRYYDWLVSHIYEPEGQSYEEMFRCLHQKVFEWSVPNDDNRMMDAYDLRHEFWGPRSEPDTAVSVLEVVVALSRRCALNSLNGHIPEVWAWTLIKNLKLDKFHDPINERQREKIEDILDNLIYRRYEPNGLGGFFPLRNPDRDQREVEIWYQMSAYLNERS